MTRPTPAPDATRIVFLDIDGVLNSDAWYDRYLSRHESIPRPPLDREAVARLDRITRATGARIVVSSSWRGIPELPRWLKEHGCGADIVGWTPRLAGDRGLEIAKWLNHTGREIEAFCILDDGDDMAHLTPYLVQTTQENGLQDEHVERAITMLGKPS